MSPKKQSEESRLNTISGNHEPEFTGNTALTEMELCHHLNWYNQHKDASHAQKYLQLFCTQNNIAFTETQIKSRSNTLGFVCRMLTRGAILSKEASKWLRDGLHKMEQVPPILPGFTPKSDRPKTQKPKPVVQTASSEHLHACMASLEAALDEFILSECTRSISPYTLMSKYQIERAQMSILINHFKKMRDEFRVAIEGSNADIVEGYSNFTIGHLKKLEAYTDLIVSDALKMMGSASVKSPRKKKVKTPEQLTKKIKYAKAHKYGEMEIVSIDPKRIIGAMALFVFNAKTRMLSCYIADTDEGLTMKGSTIQNYTESRSSGKTIRKPEVQLPQLINGGKVVAKHFLSTIHAKEKSLNGRINKDCLLLKVI